MAHTPVEHDIALAYSAAGLSPPSRIVWCHSPQEIGGLLAEAPISAPIGRSVKTDVFDSVENRAFTLAEVLHKEALLAALEADTSARLRNGAIEQVVRPTVDVKLFRFSPQVKDITRRLRGIPPLLTGGFGEIAVGPAQLGTIATLASVMDEAGADSCVQGLQALREAGPSVGWIVPYQNVCWVSERPNVIHMDAQGRLHCADGPALQYPDGWCVWAWKGIEVPAWTIRHPERITVSTLDAEIDPLVRHSLIEIMTPERLLASGAAQCLSRDETGILWGMTWTYRGVTLDAWCAVEVVDGTPGADGHYRRYIIAVPAGMRTAREAVAWTYGLTAEQYAGLQLRT